jgi:hemerythrin-like metal-binding protein
METTIDKKGVQQMPQLIAWNAAYALGIPSIDEQHRLLISMICHFQEAMLEGRTKEVVAPLLGAMNRYTEFHFNYEEQLLEQHGYAELKAHREQHANLIAALKDLEKKYNAGRLRARAPLMQFLRTWLVDHIGDDDREFAEFLKGKGVS